MGPPTLTDAHRKLEKLAGIWRGDEKIYPSPYDPKGGMAVGRVRNRTAIGGLAVVQDYEMERGGAVHFQGHGVFRWEATEQCYVLHWFDSMGMPPSVFRGAFEGDVLTLTCQSPQGHMRAAWDFRQNGRYTYRMDVSQDGAQWFPFMEAVYMREG